MDWWLLVSYVGVFAVGGYAGYKINEWVYRATFSEMMVQAGLTEANMEKFVEHWAPIMEDGEEESAKPRVQIRIELIDNQMFCYEKATDKFLGQARSRDELIDVLTEKLGPVTLLIEPEDGADYVKEGNT
jgi:hypothetical protein